MEGHDKRTPTTKPSGAVDGGQTTHGASFGADLMSFPFIHRGDAHIPQKYIEVTCHSYPHKCENGSNLLGGDMNLNVLAGSKMDSNLTGVRSDASEVLRVSELSRPELSARELRQTTSGNNIVASGYLTNTGALDTDYHNSEFRTNFMQVRSETAPGQLTRRYVPEAGNSNVSKSHVGGYFSNSGPSTSILSHAENDRVKVNNDVNGTPLRFGYPGKVDGSFLTLGMGGDMEARSGGKVVEADSSQYKSYLGQQTTRNSSSLTQLTGRAARFQHELPSSSFDLVNRTSIREDGGLITGANARLSSNLLSRLQTPQADIQHNFSYNVDRNSGFHYDLAPPQLPFRSTFMSRPVGAMSTPMQSEPTVTTYLSSTPISVQPQNYYRQSSMNVPAESSMNSYTDCHRGSSFGHAQLGHLTPTFPASFQPVGQLYSPQTVSSADAHRNSLFHERIAFPLSRGAADNPFPKRLGVQPIDFAAARTTEGNLHRTRNRGPVDNFQKPVTPPFAPGNLHQIQNRGRVDNFQTPVTPPFAPGNMNQIYNRGPADNFQKPVTPPFATGNLHLTQNRGPVDNFQKPVTPPFVTGNLLQMQNRGPVDNFQKHVAPPFATGNLHETQNRGPIDNFQKPVTPPFASGNLHQTQNRGPVDNFQKPVTPPFATGLQVGFASQVKPLGTTVPSGQHQSGMPAQLSNDSLRVDYTKGQLIPAAKFVAQPLASPISHYRWLKRGANENPLDSRLAQRRKIIPRPVLHQSVTQQRQHIPAPIPSPGFDGPPKPSGHNCCLCKRDLSFTPEGPVSQPDVPPAVAVLPCGHTFHDHCLQIITPDVQSKDPPCIPCAIGET